MSASACFSQSSLFLNCKRMAAMFNRRSFIKLGSVVVLSLIGVAGAYADTLKQITSSSAQGANDSLTWSQKGADGTVLAASFTATTAMANSVTAGMGAANSVISVVCTATPCSWTGTGFTAGHSLLWSSDAGNGGSGPVTLAFSKSISGVGASVQADLPGAFTGEIQVYNGATLLATYTVASDTAGDPVYLGAIDQSGPNINKVVFSLTTCASLCTDFGLDTVNINAATAAPAVTLTPTSLAFASTAVDSTTAAQAVTIKNSGTATLSLTSETITGTNATSFIKSATTCGTTLAAGGTCTVSVEFKPATAGALTASLSIADNATGSPQAVALTGTGTAPAITLTPTSLAFASTSVGSTTAAQVVTIKNSGTATLSLTSETITGTHATSFIKSATTCGTTLAVGGTCTVSVEFKPATAGALTASLSIADNATGSPQAVALTGTGTGTGAAAAPAVSLTPASIAFPASIVGTTSTAQLVTLRTREQPRSPLAPSPWPEPIPHPLWKLALAELRWLQVHRAHSMLDSSRLRPPPSRQR
jgi:Abnormal spindle-like microcephaly-assoc'd, ASPM-SPD-2-Hydin